MPRPGRRRTSQDPHADRFRTVDDAELAGQPVQFPMAPISWLKSTIDAYSDYGTSIAARAIREEDLPRVVRYFEYTDRLTRELLKNEESDLDAVGKLERLISSLSKDLGIGPSARAQLGIHTEAKPGSALEAFNRAEGAA